MNERTVDYRSLATSVGLLGWGAVAMLVLALFIGVRSAMPLATDLFAGVNTSAAMEQSDQRERSLLQFGEASNREGTRFVNRSAFFVPPAPIPPPPPPPPVREPVIEVPREPVEPPPPSRYGGPKIAFVWDDPVTFENDMTLAVGGDGESGVEVLSTNLPWSVKLRWRAVEFDVQLFERTTSDFLVRPEDDEDQTGSRSGDL
jgi:hypothetical protein